MKIVGNIAVHPPLPQVISRLQELAYNLWWTWNPDAQKLYESIDKELWERVSENPVKFLRTVSLQRLQDASCDDDYLQRYGSVFQRFDSYMAEGRRHVVQAPLSRHAERVDRLLQCRVRTA